MSVSGSSNPLAPTLAPLATAQALSARAAIQLISDSGFRHVQLSAALESMRPRDLGQSARRDLLTFMRRLELAPAGIDLWIPEDHFTDPAHTDRAAAAVLEAIEFAADLNRVPLCVFLPTGISADLIAVFRARADFCAVEIADHNPESAAALHIGIAPAVDLMHGLTPHERLSHAVDLAAVRLSDASKTQRVSPGTGRLDLLAMQVALTTRSFDRPCALDLRSLPQPGDAMLAALDAWITADPFHVD